MEKLKRLKKNLSAPENQPDFEALLAQIEHKTQAYKSRFLVKSGQQIRVVKIDEIAYFYSDQKLTLLVTKEGRRYPVDFSLEKVMEMLDPKYFFRANRQFIIHVDAAKKIHPYFKGRIKLELDPPVEEDVVVSSDRTPLFKDWLDQ